MSFNFPDTPTAGQTFTDTASGAQYVYTNGVWMQSSAAQIKLAASDQNILVNGSFQISQENGTTAVSAASTYPADQWMMAYSGAFSPSAQQAYIASLGRNTIGSQNGAVLASPAAAEFFIPYYQYIEGSRMLPLRWGTPQAIPAVLNFKLLASRSGTYGAVIKSLSADRAIGFDLPYTTAEGLKEFTFAIPAQTGGTWPFTNAQGATCGFSHTLGSGMKAAASGVWQNTNCNGGPGMTVNSAVASTNMQIYDAQLLPDQLGTGIAPPFVPKSFADDLRECQRYFYATHAYNTGGVHSLGLAQCYSATLADLEIRFPVPMRVAAGLGVAGQFNLNTPSGGQVLATPGAGSANSTLRVCVRMTASGSLVVGNVSTCSTSDSSARINASARM